MVMRALIDTNVILDYLLDREPYSDDARKIVIACKRKRIEGCIAAHSISNMFFILRKVYEVAERKSILKDICTLFEVEGIDKSKVLRSLDNADFKDFEDCLQMECAKSFHADYIVSRNVSDFVSSGIECILPSQFCEIMESGQ